MRFHARWARFLTIGIATVTLALPSLAAAGCDPGITRTLAYGSRGQDVSNLQLFLSDWVNPPLFTDTPTGFFGRITEASVKKFQCQYMQICSGSASANGYGVVGPKTGAAIRSHCAKPAEASYPNVPTVSNDTPKATTQFSATPLIGPAPLAVTFKIVPKHEKSYIVDFGDGQRGELQYSMCPSSMSYSNCDSTPRAFHTYTRPGTYTATLLMTDNLADCSPAKWGPCVAEAGTVTITVSQSTNILNGAPLPVMSKPPSTVPAPLSCPLPVKVYSDANSANYPRMIELADGRIFLGFSGTSNGQTNILAYTSSDKGSTWQKHSVVAQDPSRSFFAPHFIETSPGNILAAYYERCANNACNIAIKDSLYTGNTWNALGTIQTGGTDWGNGVYEPFWFRIGNRMQMYYADEFVTDIGGYAKGQNIVREEKNMDSLSGDWNSAAATVAKGDTKGNDYGERYGVPAVVRMSNGSLIAVFESTLGVANGDYGLGYAISSDDGATWSTPTPLLNPATGKRNAGGPFIAKLSDGTLVVTFSDSESNNTSLTNARMRHIYSTDNAATWYTNGGKGYVLFDDYALYGSILQLADGKIIVAKGSQTDWVAGGDNSIYVKVFSDKNQLLSCTSAPGGYSAVVPPPPPVAAVPQAPASITHSCSSGGTSITFTWPSVSGATSYWAFIKNVSSCPAGWSPDANAPGTCYSTTSNTSATFTGVAPGQSYIGWVHAGNSTGVNWNASPNTGWFACTNTN